MSIPRSRTCATALLLGALLAGAPAAAQRTPAGDEAEQAPLTLRLAGLPDTILTALYGDTAFFLPIVAIFRRVQVDVAYDSAAGRITGYYIRPDHRYTLDFQALTATTPAGLVPIARSDFIRTGEDVYVRPLLLQRLFRMRGTVDLASLTVALESPDTFPVTTTAARDLARKIRRGSQHHEGVAPLRFGRDRRLLNGLMLQYGLTGSAVAGGSYALSDLQAGGELLGGDFQGALHASGSSRSSTVTAGAAVWHYVLESPHRLLTQITAGSLTSTGLQPFPLHGVELTNEPPEVRTVLGDQVVTGMTHPDWEVELYLGDQLVGFAHADPTGRYVFNVPLAYGSSLLSIRSYGPTGGEELERRRTDVPISLVPAGRLDYWANLGRNTLDQTNGSQARAAYGVSDRLTLTSGLEYVGPDSTREAVAYGGGAFRLLPSLIVAASLAPHTLNQAVVLYSTPSQARLELTFNDFARAGAYNPLNMDRQLLLDATLPFTCAGVTTTLYTAGGFARYAAGGTDVDLNAQGLLNLGAVKPSFAYRRSVLDGPGGRTTILDQATAGVLYSVAHPPGALALLAGALVSASADYELRDRQVSRIQAAVARSIGRSNRLSIGYDYAPVSRIGRLQLRFQVDRQTVQTSSTLEASSPGGSTLSQTVRGTTTFDPASREWTFSGREGVGRAGAIFRFFVDANGNGRLDEGEELFKGPQIRFQQAATMKRLADGRVRVSDLLPYYRYSVDVDQSQVLNPLWVPRYTRFSFIADPNAFKVMDVPFYAAGELEGEVLEGDGADARGVAGLTIHLRRTDEPGTFDVVTFSDGTFYAPTVPPGTYAIAPDSAQLAILHAVSVPAARALVVPATAQGITLSGIEFRLKSLPAVP